MSTLSTSTQSAGASAPFGWSFPDHRRFTRDDYHRMAEVGLIDSEAKVELLNGEIVPMSPVGYSHSGVVDDLIDFFIQRRGDRFRVRGQNPQATSDISEPEPDVQLIRDREDRYRTGHPGPSDVYLVIEVADSSLKRDLGPKMQIYAAAGIVEYWVIDLVNRKLVVHTEPDQPAAGYKSVVSHDEGAKVAPKAAEDCVLDLAWLFGPKGTK